MKENTREKRTKPAELRTWKQNESDKLVSLYNTGMSRTEIGAKLGRSEGSVANRIRILIRANIIKSRRRG
jgi:DNA-binding NarL/FixJ family response regulator